MAPVFIKRYSGGGIKFKPSVLYGIRIDQTDSDTQPVKVTYLEDCKNFTPGHMDFSSLVFDYGSWKNVWPIDLIKPCILNNDGSVYRYLNPNKYSLDISGATVDIGTTCVGNVMVEIPRIFWKINRIDDNIADLYISDGQPDNGFRCWSHINADDAVIDNFYMAAYDSNVTKVSSSVWSMKSVSGIIAGKQNLGLEFALEAAKQNYPSGNIWFVENYCDYTLITILLLLIGRSVNAQTTFGQGITGISGGVRSIKTGSLDDKGMFYCASPKPNVNSIAGSPVKTLGIENWWGDMNRCFTGLYKNKAGSRYVKMTYGTIDGSKGTGFVYPMQDYIEVEDDTVDRSPYNGRITKMYFDEYGFYPTEVGSTSINSEAENYGYCDGIDNINTFITIAHGGGAGSFSSYAKWPWNGAPFTNGMFRLQSMGTSSKFYNLVCRPAA